MQMVNRASGCGLVERSGVGQVWCWEEELRAFAVAEMSCGEMSAVRQRGCGATSGRYYAAKKNTDSRRVRADDGAGFWFG